MGLIQTQALTHEFFWNAYVKNVNCGIHHTPEARHVKIAYDVPHMCQYIPSQT